MKTDMSTTAYAVIIILFILAFCVLVILDIRERKKQESHSTIKRKKV
jgi:hypothetical protein